MRALDLLKQAGLPTDRPAESLSSGPSGQVWRIGDYVVKTLAGASSNIFHAEARGLRTLLAAGCRTPKVHFVNSEGLVTDFVSPGQDQWDDLAHQLAHLHQSKANHYHDPGPTYLGAFQLPSAPGSSDWSDFWRCNRIQPLLEVCDLGDGRFRTCLEDLLTNYDSPSEGPVWIHGDLWNGNVLMSEDGAVLIDPSVWVGERAVDLSMMTLFGGFPSQFWHRYEALYPIPDQVRAALPFYQLYYLLVHVHLFGGHYLNQVKSVVRHYGYSW